MTRASRAVRWLALGGAGIGAFYAAASLSGQAPGDAIVAAVQRPARAASAAEAIGVAPGSQPSAERVAPGPATSPALPRHDRSGDIPGDTGDPFGTTSWVAPPPPPPKPVAVVAAPPAPAVAPPLPFTFVGLVEKGTAKPQAFLSKGDELLVVAPGDLLDNGSYRVEAVGPGQIVFMHLPTNTKQVISLSGGSQ